MQRIRRGKYDTTIDEIQSHNEIGELFQGFNEMARKIRQDKEQMENYIHEITVLKDYNEKIIHSIGAGIIIINGNLDVEKINDSFLEHFNLDEHHVLGKNIQQLHLDIIDEAIVENIQAILRSDKEEYSKVKRAKKNKVYEIKLYPLKSLPHHAETYAAYVSLLFFIQASTLTAVVGFRFGLLPQST